MINAGLTAGLTKRLCNGLGGGVGAADTAIVVPTTDLIQANPYPNLGTLPTWTATAGGDVTCDVVTTDSGTGLIFNTTAQFGTLAEVGPTANKPFTFCRVFKYVASWSAKVGNAADTAYFSSFAGDSCYILSTNGGFLGGFPVSAVTSGYIVERIRRNTAGAMFYATTGKTEVSVATGQGASLFPFSRYIGNNAIPFLSHFLYSGDNGDLTESGQWANLAAWISANNFGASL